MVVAVVSGEVALAVAVGVGVAVAGRRGERAGVGRRPVVVVAATFPVVLLGVARRLVGHLGYRTVRRRWTCPACCSRF